ncbi:MAG: Holliday junction resolvase RuvX, partial [Burkholderiales bacterium]|nr:Holliday junction resolvase RuvX [Burkholderiales bacterium]
MTASAVPSARPPPPTFVAFDYGARRIGVAVGNALLKRARPLRTITAAGAARFDAIAALLREW